MHWYLAGALIFAGIFFVGITFLVVYEFLLHNARIKESQVIKGLEFDREPALGSVMLLLLLVGTSLVWPATLLGLLSAGTGYLVVRKRLKAQQAVDAIKGEQS